MSAIRLFGPFPSSARIFLTLLTILLCFAAVASAAPCALNPASPSVTICTPANGATVTSPVQVTAGTTDNAHPVTTMIVYLDNAIAYKTNANQLSTSLTLTKGQHNITINAWDSSGAVFKSTVIVTASGSGTAPVSVAVSPSSATIAPSATQQFTAKVLNTSNTAVTWSVDGVINGNSTFGTITPSGLYTAPATNGTHNVVATSQADTTKSDTAIVTVTSTSSGCTDKSPAPSITICSPTPSSTVSNPVQLSAAGDSNYAITQFLVYVNNVLKYSTASSTVNTSLTLPSGNNHIVYQFYSNGAWTIASEYVTVSAGVSISVSPSTASVAPNATQQFTATVTGSTNTAASWAVDGTPGGNSSIGTIDSTGLYTAPSTLGTRTITATSAADTTKSAHATITVQNPPPPGLVPVTMYHNDVSRDGANTNETTLNPSNVNQSTFGKKYTFPVDGQVYAQPLYLPNLTIAGAQHNVVFVATENDTMYAFDADGSTTSPLWSVHFGTPLSSTDTEGISPAIGITSTPVIDTATNTIYVVSHTVESSGRTFRLHALDVSTGAEKFGGSKIVTGTVSGTGYDSVNGKITLERSCYQRAALALDGNNVYIGFGHCSHGWILSYYKTTLAAVGILNTTPNGGGGAIWNAGGAPAIDSSGNMFLISAVDAGDPASGYNDSFLKISTALSILDFFMPSNEAFLRANDADLGSGDVVLMPINSSIHPNEVIGGGKDGRIFVIDRDNMGEFNSTTDQVIQKVQTGTQQFDNIFSTPGFWNGNLYIHCENDVLKEYSWSSSTGLLSSTYTSKGAHVFGVHGATVSISSNGSVDGIVWEIESTAQTSGGPAILHAYDANNVATELYNSSQAGTRDTAGPAVKFVVPTVTDGKVFVGTGNELDVYGLL
jgi:hypothetical protein